MNVGQEMSEEGERRVREDCYKIERGVEPRHAPQVLRYRQLMYVSHRLHTRAAKVYIRRMYRVKKRAAKSICSPPGRVFFVRFSE